MLDLDVFQGPFDLLLALVMREEIELAELPIAEIVVAYVEHAYERRRARPRVGERVPGADRGAARDQGAPAVPRRGGRRGAVHRRGGRGGAVRAADRVPPLRRRRALAGRPRGPRQPRVFRAGPAPLRRGRSRRSVPFSEDPWAAARRDRPAAHAAAGDRPDRGAAPAGAGQRLPGRVPPPAHASGARSASTRRCAGLDRLSQAAAFLAVLELYKTRRGRSRAGRPCSRRSGRHRAGERPAAGAARRAIAWPS